MPAGSWVEPGLGVEMDTRGEHMPINIPWAWEFTGGTASWIQHFHPGGPGLTPGWGTKNLQAAQCSHRRKKNKGKK